MSKALEIGEGNRADTVRISDTGPVEVVMTKAEVEAGTQEGLKKIRQAIDMIFIGGEK